MRKPSPDAAGKWPSPQEIQDVLADEGYSADMRKGWLKEALVELERQQSAMPSADRKKLIDEIKTATARNQRGKPMSDDVM